MPIHYSPDGRPTKDSDAHVKFALLTGVSKFSKVSIFSGLNNLQDITLDHRYGALCGYTEADVETVFAPELPGLDRRKIRDRYNGYNWLGSRFTTPSTCCCCSLTAVSVPGGSRPEPRPFSSSCSWSGASSDDISPDRRPFQSGYLTIAEVQKRGERTGYVLGYPNREVQISLNERITRALTAGGRQQIQHLNRLYDLLLVNDFTGLQALFSAFYSSIPHAWYDSSRIADYEGFYASVFYSYFASLGLRLICEDITSKGPIDRTLDWPRLRRQVCRRWQVHPFDRRGVQQGEPLGGGVRAGDVPFLSTLGLGRELARSTARVVGAAERCHEIKNARKVTASGL